MATRKNTQTSPTPDTYADPGKTPKATGAMPKRAFQQAIRQAARSPDSEAIGSVGKQECDRLGLRPTRKHAQSPSKGGSHNDAQSIFPWMRRIQSGDMPAERQLMQITATAGG